MKKLAFDEMEKVQGGACTNEIIGWAGAFATFNVALTNLNNAPSDKQEAAEWAFGTAAAGLAAADAKWLSCMGWL